MSRDLREVLGAFADHEARASAATAPDAGLETRRLGRQIARRRAARAGAVSLASAAAVVGLAVGVAAVADRPDPPPPAEQSPAPSVLPTPSPTPTAAPPPTPVPTATPDATLQPVSRHPLLPQAEPLPPGTFATTGAGWVLAQRSLVAGTGEGDGPMERTYFYLVDPSGARYEVPFATDRSVNLVDWLPGTSTAVVQLGGPGDWSVGVSVVDLQSGTFGDLPEGVHGSPLLASDGTVVVAGGDGTVATWSPDGTALASIDVGGLGVFGAHLDPSRTRLSVTVQGEGVLLLDLDLRPLPSPGATAHLAERRCVDAWWLDETTLVTACPDPGQEGTLAYWTVPLDGPAQVLTGVTTPDWSRLGVVRAAGETYVHLPARTDLGTGLEVAPAQLSRVEGDGTLTPVDPVLARPVATGPLVVGVLDLPDGRSGDLVALDGRTGTTFVVMPADGGLGGSDGTTYTTWSAHP